MRFRDFDQFWSEKQGEPLRLKVFGEVHELPPSLPAAIMVQTMRLQATKQDEVPAHAVLVMAEAVLGTDRLNQWLAKGLTVNQLMDLIMWVIEAYNDQGTPSGNMEAPAQIAGA